MLFQFKLKRICNSPCSLNLKEVTGYGWKLNCSVIEKNIMILMIQGVKVTMPIHNKDDIEFVTEFHVFWDTRTF